MIMDFFWVKKVQNCYVVLVMFNFYFIWWIGGSLGIGFYIRVDIIIDDVSGLKSCGFQKLEDIN